MTRPPGSPGTRVGARYVSYYLMPVYVEAGRCSMASRRSCVGGCRASRASTSRRSTRSSMRRARGPDPRELRGDRRRIRAGAQPEREERWLEARTCHESLGRSPLSQAARLHRQASRSCRPPRRVSAVALFRRRQPRHSVRGSAGSAANGSRCRPTNSDRSERRADAVTLAQRVERPVDLAQLPRSARSEHQARTPTWSEIVVVPRSRIDCDSTRDSIASRDAVPHVASGERRPRRGCAAVIA